ncbi:DUF2971 domain-containing protein [Vibrio cholerae]
MILYKYYGFNSGLDALKSSQVGFRQPDKFNDPFEFTFLYDEKNLSEHKELEKKIQSIKQSVVVLSLTRNPLNPLMWAHYCDNHAGFVVGYEVDDDFFTSDEFNLVTVNDGDVVYTNTKNPHDLTLDRNGVIHKIYLLTQGASLSIEEKESIHNLMRKMFLTKHASWVYEEEVRVIKISDSRFEPAGEFQNHPYREYTGINRRVTPDIVCPIVDGLRIYTKKHPIKEVYLGVRNPLVGYMSEWRDLGVCDQGLSIKSLSEGWKVFSVKMDDKSWLLTPDVISNEVLSIPEKRLGIKNEASINGDEIEVLLKKLSSHRLRPNDNIKVTHFNEEINIQLNGKFI